MAAVWVSSPALGLKPRLLLGLSVAGELLEDFERNTGLCDLYVVCNGRVVDRDQPLQNGSVYHLEARLRGGKGGFGSMLRALGAQIEKTTNREACRDLSGRRLRDVNHEKEMAEWLKKQAEREAEKEQRRLERLQKKLAEPKHHFTDTQYTQQCHELAERLEDSVIKGLQASCSSGGSSKRSSEEREGPVKKKKSRSNTPFTWTGLDLSDNDTDPESDPEPETPAPPSAPQGPGPSGPPSGPSSGPPSGLTLSQSEVRGPEPPGSSGAEVRPAPSEDRTEPTGPADPQPGHRQSPPPESSCRPEGDSGQSGPGPVQMKPAESSSSPEQNQDQTPDQRPVPVLDLDLDSVSGPEDLEVLGLNVLKEELMRRGLKCGGTLSERAQRLYSVKGKSDGEVEESLRAKSKRK